MSGPLLSSKGITRAFGGVVALKEVDLKLYPDQILGLIGPNGAGKTTFFNIVSGFFKPDSGAIELGGKDITNLPAHEIARAGIGRTFQNVRVFHEMTVIENVMIGRHSRASAGLIKAFLKLPSERREEREIKERAMKFLAQLEIEEHAGQEAGSLPFGKMRLLEIARALASEPSVLLLDEPAAGLNHSETGKLAQTIRDIRARGIAIILVEHDMRLVMDISDHVVVLNQGTKLAEGAPREIQNNPEVITAYLGEQSCAVDGQAFEPLEPPARPSEEAEEERG